MEPTREDDPLLVLGTSACICHLPAHESYGHVGVLTVEG